MLNDMPKELLMKYDYLESLKLFQNEVRIK